MTPDIDLRTCTRRQALENFLARTNEQIESLRLLVRDVNWYRNNHISGGYMVTLPYEHGEADAWKCALSVARHSLETQLKDLPEPTP